MLLKIKSYFTGYPVVELVDNWGKTYKTIAKAGPRGKWSAHVYPFSGVGNVVLEEDGSCSGESSYIKKWYII